MKRILVLLVAVVTAAVGALGTLVYARSADQRALAGQEVVEVFVATREVPAGTTARDAVDRGLLQPATIAAKGVPDGALTEVTEEMSAQVAMSSIAPGEIVLARRFGTQTSGQTALVVPEGMVAVTVQLSDPGRVGPFLRPGSEIAVYHFTQAEPEAAGQGEAGQELTAEEDLTRVLLPKVEVLAVGNTTLGTAQTQPGEEGQQAEQVPTALVTLALTPQDGQRLVHGVQTGTLYAALLGSGTEVPARTVDTGMLFAEAG